MYSVQMLPRCPMLVWWLSIDDWWLMVDGWSSHLEKVLINKWSPGGFHTNFSRRFSLARSGGWFFMCLYEKHITCVFWWCFLGLRSPAGSRDTRGTELVYPMGYPIGCPMGYPMGYPYPMPRVYTQMPPGDRFGLPEKFGMHSHLENDL